MPPSSLITTLYAADDNTSSTPSELPASSAQPKGTSVSVSGQLVLGNTSATAIQRVGVASCQLFPSHPQSLAMAQKDTFLEMEEDEKYEDAILDDIPLNGDESKDDNLHLIDAPLLNQGGSTEEEKKDSMECHAGVATKEDSLSYMHSDCVDGNFITCGKRRRSRRVEFVDVLDQDRIDSDQQRHNKKSLEWVQHTIHLSEYTSEERQATWYTYDDLKSFKKERKETVRRIQNGLLSLPSSSMPLSGSSDQKPNCDTYVDSTSSSKPIVYCSRGVENCTEAISRIRYRHICNGWRAVFNAQEIHEYKRQKLKRMSSLEKDQFNTLASFLSSSSKKKLSRTHRFSLETSNNGNNCTSNSRSNDSRKDPYDSMCCPYQLAAAYQPSSKASLDIARNRALCDERDVAAQNAQDLEVAIGNEIVLSSVEKPSTVKAHQTRSVLHRNKIECANKPNIPTCVERIRKNNDNSTTLHGGRRELSRRRTIDI